MSDPDVEYPSSKAILKFNQDITELYDEKYEVDDPSKIDEILEGVKEYENGNTKQERISSKAARLMFKIAAKQQFFEANKRTAYVVAVSFLEQNGFLLRIPYKEMYSLLDDVAKGLDQDFLTFLNYLKEGIIQGT